MDLSILVLQFFDFWAVLKEDKGARPLYAGLTWILIVSMMAIMVIKSGLIFLLHVSQIILMLSESWNE